MQIQKIDHLETMIGSLNKLLLDAKNKGIIKNKELSLLNLIYKLVNNKCYYDLKYCKQKQLVSLYYKLLSKYSFLCKGNITLDNTIYIKTNIKELYIDTNKNTAPTIEDPEEHEPPIGLAPELCDDAKLIFVNNSSKYPFTKNDLVACFSDPNPPYTGTVQYIKIISLPQYNPLTYQGVNVEVGQIINLNDLNLTSNLFLYTSSITEDVEDSFLYRVSTSSFPSIFNDEDIKMNIKVSL